MTLLCLKITTIGIGDGLLVTASMVAISVCTRRAAEEFQQGCCSKL
ncbi:hypothetical protein [Pelosinus baikalensis]|uniref:Uncharacterized protein n=1 Tax=Pelosinus baikalensis TaxID=2892015 RepID=A0ABS8HXT9_9FIRM|nr:hypothetical protein [Pelosinus baikalensis]MCC5466937.1 hypothetical protein [Pelosinus baikalensis]